MRLNTIRLKVSLVLLVAAAMCLPAKAMPHIHRGPTAHRVARHTPRQAKRSSPRVMDPGRATEIQTALIRTGYLSGAPSGVWDSATQAAMQKYQSDNGWQTKLTPDSRAIIKLGLGSSTSPEASWVNAPADRFSPQPVSTATARGLSATNQ